jgi:hypothetical protein
MQDRAYGLRRIHQPVEKVGIEPMATTNRLRKPQNRRIWRADPGSRRASRSFFNRLSSSTHSGE